MSVPILGVLPTSVGAADTQVILSEDFEGRFPGEWSRGDSNEASDQDYWGTTQYRSVSSSHSAYCAAIGENSQYGGASNVDIEGRGDPFWASPSDYTLRYDTNMDSYMVRELDLDEGFASLTLRFSYWAMTGSSLTSLGDDYLWISATTSTDRDPDLGAYDRVWRQTVSDSSGWRSVAVNLPQGTTWISINFHSGPMTPEGGPYIGAFVDDVQVEAEVGKEIFSQITDLPASTNQTSFSFTVVVDGDVDQWTKVEIYYRINGIGEFKQYTTASNPMGRWDAGTVTFRSMGSGQYELFSRAYNNLWSRETMKTAADAVIIVDAVPPTAVHALSGTLASDGWYSSAVRVYINATDDSSGVLSISYRWDDDEWAQYRGPVTMEENGDHVLQYFATDNAGNSQAVRTVSNIRLDRLGPVVTFEATQGCNFPHGDITIGFDLSEPASGISFIGYSVDGGMVISLSESVRQITLTGLDVGSHNIVLTAKDGVGNPSQTLLQFTVGDAAEDDPVVGTALTVAMLAVIAFPLAGAAIMLSRRKS
jgi:hypothetical protein